MLKVFYVDGTFDELDTTADETAAVVEWFKKIGDTIDGTITFSLRHSGEKIITSKRQITRMVWKDGE